MSGGSARWALARGGAAALAQGLDLAASFVTAALVARFLGASGLGLLSLWMAVFLTANTLTDLGGSALLTREVASDPSRVRRILREHLALKLPLLGVLGIVAAAAAAIEPAALPALAGFPYLALSSVNVSLAAALRGKEMFSSLLLVAVPALLVQILGVAWTLVSGRGLGSVLLILAAPQAIRLALGALALARTSPPAPAVRRERRPARLLRLVLPFGGAVLVAIAYHRADVYLVSFLAGAAATGTYTAALRVTELLKMLPGSLLSAGYPRRVRLPESAHDSRGLAAASALAAAALLAFAPELVRLVYGPGLSAAAAPLRILALGLVPGVANAARLLDLYARGREDRALRVLLYGLFANLALNLILIPRAGAAGAAASFAVSEWSMLALFHREARSRRPSPASLVEVASS